MVYTFECIDMVTEEFDKKNGGHVTLHLAVLRDADKGPLRNTVDFELKGPQKEAHWNKLAGKMVTVRIKDINQAMNGRVRLVGDVEKVA